MPTGLVLYVWMDGVPQLLHGRPRQGEMEVRVRLYAGGTFAGGYSLRMGHAVIGGLTAPLYILYWQDSDLGV